jgi:hypothetical protein
MSSLSRAFTTKRNKTPSDAGTTLLPQRSLTTKHSFSSGTIRYKISAPLELLSTTNMLSYNAPDIYPTTRSRSSSSGSESDNTSRSPADLSTPLTSPDTSSIESSPISPKPNHLSCYFGASSRTSASSDEAPKIPQRVPSHTKRSAEAIARKRSISRMSSPKSLSMARSSLNMFSSNVETMEPHPFGQELAQVSELAEEYGITAQKMEVIDSEEQELLSRGLFKFRAEDYMSEIHGLFLSAFGETKPSMATMWI